MSVKKLKLKHPLTWGADRIVEELNFRRPKGKDVYHFPSKPTNGDMAKLAGKLLVGEDMSSLMIDELDLEDFIEVMDIVGNFIDPSLETGDKQSA